ncbi:hypothetical protein CALVIDRAFT_538781 [Calocera viscosa TUFC12733]|uniref:Uncharacterized protein n=1 Tax=Calocera viscosa (strain TUFC12733) TaxID=1330018 RepID=A0A167KHP2_CALVF|nr:hypothetical protein CALVIDRAFT_538781 [Calocera viscosa TUFC12733]
MASGGAYVPPHRRNGAETIPTSPTSTRPSGTSHPANSQKSAIAPVRVFPTAFNRQPPNRFPRPVTYSDRDIRDRILGGTTHTFSRALMPVPANDDMPAQFVDPSMVDLPWDETICRIMVHKDAHLNPPEELWTRNNFDLLERNRNRRIPLFQQLTRGWRWEYKGRYEVVSYTIYKGGSDEVKKFILERQESQKEKSPEAWAAAFTEDWAKVELRLSDDQSLGNPMEL